MNEFQAGEHGGTHFDAPYHFNKNGWKVGEVPLERLITKGAVIDVPNGNLLVKHLEQWESTNGPFVNNTVLLINFSWAPRWLKGAEEYFAKDSEGKYNFPGTVFMY